MSPGEAAEDRGPLGRALSVVADVRRGEAITAALLALDVFLLLFASYLLKTTRESIVGMPHGPFVKVYTAGAMALLLVPLLKAYELASERISRMALMTATTLFFVGCLGAFALLLHAGVPIVVPFYVWVGIFNMFVVSQVWSFANDIHSEERGRRVFPLVAVGSCVGAVVGSLMAKRFDAEHLGRPMLFAAGLLLLALSATFAVHVRASREEPGRPSIAPPLARGGGIALLLKDRYFLFIAAMLVVYNCVNTVGEFVLDSGVRAAAEAAHADVGTYAISFRGDFNAIVNLASLGLQLFVVSRALAKLGVRGALFVMPIVSLLGYTGIAASGALLVMQWAKIGENSVDYSLQWTTRQALFLVTTREEKYKVKALVETFFVRFGDVCAALLVWAGSQMLHLTPRGLAAVNVGLVLVWVALAWGIAKRHRLKSHVA